MAVDERARHRLHTRLDEVLGPEVTGTLMELLPPVGWADVATTHDLTVGLAALGDRIDAQIADLRTELRTGLIGTESGLRKETADLGTELRTGMADVRTEMSHLRTELRTGMADVRTEMADLRTGLRTGMADVRSDLRQEMAANQRQVMFGLFAAIAANAGVVWAALAFAT